MRRPGEILELGVLQPEDHFATLASSASGVVLGHGDYGVRVALTYSSGRFVRKNVAARVRVRFVGALGVDHETGVALVEEV